MLAKIGILKLIQRASSRMSRYLRSFARHLDREVFELTVACPGSEIRAEMEIEGVRVLPVDFRAGVLSVKWYASLACLVNFLKEKKIDVLHTYGSDAALPGGTAALLARTPVVLHSIVNSCTSSPRKMGQFSLNNGVDRIFYNLAHSVIIPWEGLRHELIDTKGIDPGKIETIYNGVEINSLYIYRDRVSARRKLGIPQLGLVVGVVTRLEPQVELRYFLQAASYLVQDFQVNFIVVGEGSLRAALEEEALSLGLKNRLFFTGEVEDISVALQAFDIFVAPSAGDGLPVAALEAMTAARPVVGISAGGIPEVIQSGHTGILVEEGNPSMMARAIAGLIVDREGAAQIGQAGRDLIKERFNAGIMAEKTSNLYLQALNQKGRLLVNHNRVNDFFYFK